MNQSKAYQLETEVPGFGKIQAVKSGDPRDYLLIDEHGTVSWLDETMVTKLLKEQTDE
jgi:hypothetical protein